MFKKLLQVGWKITKILFVILLLSFWSGQLYLNQQDHTYLTIELNRLNRQLFEVNDRLNEMLDNDIFMTGQINKGEISEQTLNNKIVQLNLEYQKNNKEIQDILNKTKYIDEIDTNRLLSASVLISNGFGQGSGTVIKKTDTEMYILTCYHVIEGADVVSVGYNKTDKSGKVGGMTIFAGEVVKIDIELDLALVKTSVVDNEIDVVNLAETDPQKGDNVYTVGNPLGILRNISKGILSNKLDGFYITDALTTFGNSGGGLFNGKGELIGVPDKVPVYGLIDNIYAIPESNLGYSIALPIIKEFLKEVL